MQKGRLEAFSDGVIAILITIMVLEIKTPHSADISALKPILPILLSYGLSFIYIGIYWNNHHHLLMAAKHINGWAMWANLHLLFWLSLIPFATSWLGENHMAQWPLALYGGILLMCGLAYTILARILTKQSGPDSMLAKAVGKDRKGQLSVLLYATAIVLTFYFPIVSLAIYILLAVIWFIPDPRVERYH